MGEELGGHDSADRVAAEVLLVPVLQQPVAEEPRHGVGSTLLERATEDVALLERAQVEFVHRPIVARPRSRVPEPLPSEPGRS
ncbi:MAG: hypothetical protein V9E94_07395 [Microthrixaceae bacterium]